MTEQDLFHGAIHQPLITAFKRATRPQVAASAVPFDWNKGFDIEDVVGKVTIKNQGQSSSCGGQAGSQFIACAKAYQTESTYLEESAKSVYAPIAYPGGGTTTGALENRIVEAGSDLETAVSSYENGFSPSEAFMTDRTWMTPQNLADAVTNAGWSILNVGFDIDSIAQAIEQYGGVIVMLGGQNNGTWLSNNPQPPVDSNGLWHHFLYFGKAKMVNGQKAVACSESWGENVGDAGWQWFNENYFASGFVVDIFTASKNIPLQKFVFNTDMYVGVTSADVKQLQIRLGMPSALQTGYYGRITQGYVVAYQIKNHIHPISGYCGPITRAHLNAS